MHSSSESKVDNEVDVIVAPRRQKKNSVKKPAEPFSMDSSIKICVIDDSSASAATTVANSALTQDSGCETKEAKRRIRKVALASVAGNVLEWYDFGVFAFLAPQIGALFFPKASGTAQIINALVVFGGAFVVRPFGGIMFGHIGDVYGRKKALLLSVAMMAASTFTMGCLPTYEHIGVSAPVLLALLRLFQGLSVGGELVGSIVYSVESAQPHRQVLMGALCMGSAQLGLTLGACTGLLLHAVFDADQARRSRGFSSSSSSGSSRRRRRRPGPPRRRPERPGHERRRELGSPK